VTGFAERDDVLGSTPVAEIVYVLTNEAITRIRGLYQSGVPLPFELFYA
jgi:hypothetical protein